MNWQVFWSAVNILIGMALGTALWFFVLRHICVHINWQEVLSAYVGTLLAVGTLGILAGIIGKLTEKG